MSLTLISGILLFAATPAQSAAQDAPAPPKKQKLICRRDTTVGTRLAHRTCLTESRWKDMDEAAELQKRRMMDTAERSGRSDDFPGPKPN
ncbi:MAG: hypothetical protein V4574_05145 [Pseudomonadota bacterium]